LTNVSEEDIASSFRKEVSHASMRQEASSACCLLLSGSLLGLLPSLGDGNITFLQNVSELISNYVG
jgi:hypothetical protein